MGLIFDTSVLIRAEMDDVSLRPLFTAFPDESFYLTAISASELLHGVERAHPPARQKTRSQYVEGVLSMLEVIDFDLVVARRHAQLWAALERKGTLIGAHDAIIAATALARDFDLITLNLAEFSRVPNLRLVDPALLRH